MEVNDDGAGMDQPVMENGELAIFQVEGGYEVRRFGEGRVGDPIPGKPSDGFWDALEAQGWEYVDLN